MVRREQVLSGGRSAFTLVELLVVVSIIALMLALLTPTLRRARVLAINAQCAANQKNWGNSLGAYATANRGAFPYNGPAKPELGIPVSGQHVSWNGSTVQEFWRRYLLPNTKASKTDEHDVLNCPTQRWHQINDVNLAGGLVGYFYLPHRDPNNINYAPAGNEDGKNWVSKTHFGGPWSHTPILMDMKQYGTWNNSWFYTSSVPFSSHYRPDGEPEGGYYLFEDGRVAWYSTEVIEVGATMGSWLCFYKIPL